MSKGLFKKISISIASLALLSPLVLSNLNNNANAKTRHLANSHIRLVKKNVNNNSRKHYRNNYNRKSYRNHNMSKRNHNVNKRNKVTQKKSRYNINNKRYNKKHVAHKRHYYKNNKRYARKNQRKVHYKYIKVPVNASYNVIHNNKHKTDAQWYRENADRLVSKYYNTSVAFKRGYNENNKYGLPYLSITQSYDNNPLYRKGWIIRLARIRSSKPTTRDYRIATRDYDYAIHKYMQGDGIALKDANHSNEKTIGSIYNNTWYYNSNA